MYPTASLTALPSHDLPSSLWIELTEQHRTDAEASAYLYTAVLTQPMDHEGSQSYLYIATRTYQRWGKNEVPQDIAVDSISDYQMGGIESVKRMAVYEVG